MKVETDAEHAAAIAELEELMGVEDGPLGDRLMALAIAIEEYELVRWPIPPPEPYHHLNARGDDVVDLRPYMPAVLLGIKASYMMHVYDGYSVADLYQGNVPRYRMRW